MDLSREFLFGENIGDLVSLYETAFPYATYAYFAHAGEGFGLVVDEDDIFVDEKYVVEFHKIMPSIPDMVEEGFFWTMSTLVAMHRKFQKEYGEAKTKIAADVWLNRWIAADQKKRETK